MSELKGKENGEFIVFRFLYVVLFLCIFQIIELALVLIVILQFCYRIFAGDANGTLTRYGQNLSVYARELIAYATFASEQKPYPFHDFPDHKELSDS